MRNEKEKENDKIKIVKIRLSLDDIDMIEKYIKTSRRTTMNGKETSAWIQCVPSVVRYAHSELCSLCSQSFIEDSYIMDKNWLNDKMLRIIKRAKGEIIQEDETT
jgi:hypothetical protein